jgi:hypothetical protein
MKKMKTSANYYIPQLQCSENEYKLNVCWESTVWFLHLVCYQSGKLSKWYQGKLYHVITTYASSQRVMGAFKIKWILGLDIIRSTLAEFVLWMCSVLNLEKYIRNVMDFTIKNNCEPYIACSIWLEYRLSLFYTVDLYLSVPTA